MEPESNNSLVLDTKYGWTLRLRNDNMTPTVSDQSDKYTHTHTWYNHKRNFAIHLGMSAVLFLFYLFLVMFCVNCTHQWANLESTTWVSLWRIHRRTAAAESVRSRRQKNLSIFSCVRIKPSNNNNNIFNNVEKKIDLILVILFSSFSLFSFLHDRGRRLGCDRFLIQTEIVI